MVVGGKEGLAPQAAFVGAVFQHRAGDGHAVVGAGAPADLVQDQQALGRGVAQQLGHLGHLHHERGLPGGQIVRGAHPGEYPVHNAHMGAPGGDEGAHLGHEDDEGGLPHVGGFARHVGARNDGHQVFPRVHMYVVGNEEGVFEDLLHHRMAALRDVQLVGEVHRGLAVAAGGSHGGEGGQHVHLGHGGGGLLDAADLFGHRLPKGAEELVLQRHDPVLGGEDGVLHVLELLGDEPLAVHQGLLADIGVGHQVVIGLGDLDVIPEHLVVAHLQVLDAGLFPLRLFDGGHHGLAVGHDVPEVVHVAIVARFDEAALPDGEGRLLHQRPGNVLPQVLEVVDGLPQDREQGGAERSEERPEPGQLPQAAGEGHQVPGPCGAVNDAPDEPLQVRHLPEALGDLLPGDGVPHQILHGRSIQERMSRCPIAVRVLSSTQRREPFFSLPRMVSVSSRFRRAVRSSSINSPPV